LSLEEVDRIPAGQLEAEWEGTDVVRVSKGDQPVLWLSVERPQRHATRMIQSPAHSNVKLKGVFGLIDSISQGCLRRATGWERSSEACFAFDGEDEGGCYVEHGKWANRHGIVESYDITANGLTNCILGVRIPASGSADLSRRSGYLFRTDAESTDGAMSISLGLVQMWAESNPQKRFMTICSHVFRPSDGMMAWLSALRNLWVGHTVSAWLSDEELEARFASIERFLRWGIPSVIWVATHRDWQNDRVVRRALDLVPPRSIIEAPCRHRVDDQELPVLKCNPLGACSDHRVTVDHEGIEEHYHVVRDGDAVKLVNEIGREPSLPAHSKCRGCKLLCGLHVLQERRKRS
jgi:hypothetical protein